MSYSPNLIMHISLMSIYTNKFKKYLYSEDNTILYSFVFLKQKEKDDSLSEELYSESCKLIKNNDNEDKIIESIVIKANDYFMKTGASENLLQCSNDFASYIFSSAFAYVLKENQNNILQNK